MSAANHDYLIQPIPFTQASIQDEFRSQSCCPQFVYNISKE